MEFRRRFGIRFWCTLCFVIVVSILPNAAATRAAPECSNGTCTVYLPLIRVAPPPPQLIEPANGATVTSLAPLLRWSPVEPGTYQVQVASDPAFTTLVFTTTTRLNAPVQPQVYVMGTNQIQTTLYWRVGELRPEGTVFSPTWSFTTPAKDSSKLLLAPGLVAPANQATVPAQSVTVNWQSLPGALYYRVGVYAPDGSQVAADILAAPTTAFTVNNLSAGTTYSWRVKALNAYGWSVYSTSWSFTTS